MQGYAKLFVILLAGCFLYGLSACRNEPVKKTAEPPSVTVSLPVQADAQKHLEYTGSTAALESVDIRARVPGFLEKISFEPQQNVKRGTCSSSSTLVNMRPLSKKRLHNWNPSRLHSN